MDENVTVMRHKELAGAVILYQPDINVLQNIDSYIGQLDILYVVDNSEQINQDIHSSLSLLNVRILHTGSNLGMAAALNLCAKSAFKHGFRLMLTMDQDSSFPANDINVFKNIALALRWDRVGILTPAHNIGKNRLNVPKAELIQLDYCMTSGNIINLQLLIDVGGFDERLFIDHVDHDYCFRLKRAGLQIWQSNKVYLRHGLGDIKVINVCRGFQLRFISHSAVRTYYFIRNGLFLASNYPERRAKLYKLIGKELIKSLFFEEKRKEYRVFIMKAFKDYKAKSFGKIKFIKDR